jgi:copper chaperone CopZ
MKAKAEKIEKAIKKDGDKSVKVKAEKKESGEKAVKEKKEVKKDTAKDGKEKVKAVTGEEAEALIKRYLREQNRPYSATEVSANLHGKVCFFFLIIFSQKRNLGCNVLMNESRSRRQ